MGDKWEYVYSTPFSLLLWNTKSICWIVYLAEQSLSNKFCHCIRSVSKMKCFVFLSSWDPPVFTSFPLLGKVLGVFLLDHSRVETRLKIAPLGT